MLDDDKPMLALLGNVERGRTPGAVLKSTGAGILHGSFWNFGRFVPLIRLLVPVLCQRRRMQTAVRHTHGHALLGMGLLHLLDVQRRLALFVGSRLFLVLARTAHQDQTAYDNA